MDVESIEAGANFIEKLEGFVRRCTAVIVIIGPNWLNLMDDNNGRRIDDESDTVRLEIELAISEEVALVPVLVGGAKMPKERDLPQCIRRITQINAAEVSHKRFHSDVSELITTIERQLDTVFEMQRTPTPRHPSRYDFSDNVLPDRSASIVRPGDIPKDEHRGIAPRQPIGPSISEHGVREFTKYVPPPTAEK
jgi:hypothetical protein